ncbi:hypothetical protein NZL82_02275 [Sphingomonas sanguinis]|nr:hypothetical protein [Sphingomonas sp. LC-1]MCT8000700.1 hypothetical protein [Sphingomonas sp. LC-1]
MKRLAIAMGGGVLMALVAVATHPSPAPAAQASSDGPATLAR